MAGINSSNRNKFKYHRLLVGIISLLVSVYSTILYAQACTTSADCTLDPNVPICIGGVCSPCRASHHQCISKQFGTQCNTISGACVPMPPNNITVNIPSQVNSGINANVTLTIANPNRAPAITLSDYSLEINPIFNVSNVSSTCEINHDKSNITLLENVEFITREYSTADFGTGWHPYRRYITSSGTSDYILVANRISGSGNRQMATKTFPGNITQYQDKYNYAENICSADPNCDHFLIAENNNKFYRYTLGYGQLYDIKSKPCIISFSINTNKQGQHNLFTNLNTLKTTVGDTITPQAQIEVVCNSNEVADSNNNCVDPANLQQTPDASQSGSVICGPDEKDDGFGNCIECNGDDDCNGDEICSIDKKCGLCTGDYTDQFSGPHDNCYNTSYMSAFSHTADELEQRLNMCMQSCNENDECSWFIFVPLRETSNCYLLNYDQSSNCDTSKNSYVDDYPGSTNSGYAWKKLNTGFNCQDINNPACINQGTENAICVECAKDSQCHNSERPICDNNTCVKCTSDEQCENKFTLKKFCNLSSGECEECNINDDVTFNDCALGDGCTAGGACKKCDANFNEQESLLYLGPLPYCQKAPHLQQVILSGDHLSRLSECKKLCYNNDACEGFFFTPYGNQNICVLGSKDTFNTSICNSNNIQTYNQNYNGKYTYILNREISFCPKDKEICYNSDCMSIVDICQENEILDESNNCIAVQDLTLEKYPVSLTTLITNLNLSKLTLNNPNPTSITLKSFNINLPDSFTEISFKSNTCGARMSNRIITLDNVPSGECYIEILYKAPLPGDFIIDLSTLTPNIGVAIEASTIEIKSRCPNGYYANSNGECEPEPSCSQNSDCTYDAGKPHCYDGKCTPCSDYVGCLEEKEYSICNFSTGMCEQSLPPIINPNSIEQSIFINDNAKFILTLQNPNSTPATIIEDYIINLPADVKISSVAGDCPVQSGSNLVKITSNNAILDNSKNKQLSTNCYFTTLCNQVDKFIYTKYKSKTDNEYLYYGSVYQTQSSSYTIFNYMDKIGTIEYGNGSPKFNTCKDWCNNNKNCGRIDYAPTFQDCNFYSFDDINRPIDTNTCSIELNITSAKAGIYKFGSDSMLTTNLGNQQTPELTLIVKCPEGQINDSNGNCIENPECTTNEQCILSRKPICDPGTGTCVACNDSVIPNGDEACDAKDTNNKLKCITDGSCTIDECDTHTDCIATAYATWAGDPPTKFASCIDGFDCQCTSPLFETSDHKCIQCDNSGSHNCKINQECNSNSFCQCKPGFNQILDASSVDYGKCIQCTDNTECTIGNNLFCNLSSNTCETCNETDSELFNDCPSGQNCLNESCQVLTNLTLQASISPEEISPGDTSTITINIINPNTGPATLTDPFIINLPTGISPTNISGTCVPNGVSSLADIINGNQLIFPVGSEITNGNCTIIFDITPTTIGQYPVTIGILKTSLGDATVEGPVVSVDSPEESIATFNASNNQKYCFVPGKDCAGGDVMKTDVNSLKSTNPKLKQFLDGITPTSKIQQDNTVWAALVNVSLEECLDYCELFEGYCVGISYRTIGGLRCAPKKEPDYNSCNQPGGSYTLLDNNHSTYVRMGSTTSDYESFCMSCGPGTIINASKQCIECPENYISSNNQCIDCAATGEIAINNQCVDPTKITLTVKCSDDSHCSENNICGTDRTCNLCTENYGSIDSHACPEENPICKDKSTNNATCVQCLDSSNCLNQDNPICENITNSCKPCATDTECENKDTLNPICDTATGQCGKGCASDTECIDVNNPICNTTTYSCKPCTSDTECLTKDTVNPICDTATGQCGKGCASDIECIDVNNPICNTTTYSCKPCTSDTECLTKDSANPICDTTTGQCGKGCATDTECIDVNYPICDTTTQYCKPCTSDTECLTKDSVNPICDTATGQCGKGCATDTECTELNNPICDTKTQYCKKCATDEECITKDATNPLCDTVSGACIAECTTDEQCPYNVPVCNNGTCSPCTLTDNSECTRLPTTPVCNTENGQCEAECASDAECTTSTEPICDINQGQCVACTATTDRNTACSNKNPDTPYCGTSGVCGTCNNSILCTNTRPICDLTNATCVECNNTVIPDGNAACDAKDPNNTLVCVTDGSCAFNECAIDTDCISPNYSSFAGPAPDGLATCSSNYDCLCTSPLFENADHKCIQCDSSGNYNCNMNEICNNENFCECAANYTAILDTNSADYGKCVQCTDNNVCQDTTPICDVNNTVANSGFTCKPCSKTDPNLACPNGDICNDDGSCTAPACTTDAECTTTAEPICDIKQGQCVACTATADGNTACNNKNPVTPYCGTSGACGPCNNSSLCTDTTPICDLTIATCVECNNTAVPDGNAACDAKDPDNTLVCSADGSCAFNECTTDTDCISPNYASFAGPAPDGLATCSSNYDCLCTSPLFENADHKCIQCDSSGNHNCNLNEICNTENFCECATGYSPDEDGTCAEDIVDACSTIVCEDGKYCHLGICECPHGINVDANGNCIQQITANECENDLYKTSNGQCVECTEDEHCSLQAQSTGNVMSCYLNQCTNVLHNRARPGKSACSRYYDVQSINVDNTCGITNARIDEINYNLKAMCSQNNSSICRECLDMKNIPCEIAKCIYAGMEQSLNNNSGTPYFIDISQCTTIIKTKRQGTDIFQEAPNLYRSGKVNVLVSCGDGRNMPPEQCDGTAGCTPMCQIK